MHACTDVTGFGLMGHALEMAKGSGVGIRINADDVPVLPRVRQLAEEGFVPGGTKNNFTHVQDSITFPDRLDQIGQWILCDAVTSGGLLISVAGGQGDELLGKLKQSGVEAAIIGATVADHAGRIVVL